MHSNGVILIIGYNCIVYANVVLAEMWIKKVFALNDEVVKTFPMAYKPVMWAQYKILEEWEFDEGKGMHCM